MKTNRLSVLVFGSITVAIHLIGVAAVGLGAQQLAAQSVSYRDLNLSRSTDAAVLYHRIGQAAAQVCETFKSAQPPREALRNRCVDKAIAKSVARIHDASFTAQYRAVSKLHPETRSPATAT
jgi:UrcA family protein